MTIDKTPDAVREAVQAVRGISDDYQTSEVHHPYHVLIPLARFQQLQAAEASLAALDTPAPAVDGEPNHIDPETGRPVGDHGTGEQAIDWILNHSGDSDPGNIQAFLKCWNQGSAYEEWPEYYVWLKTQDV